jgi:hypothetical protein
VTTVATPLRAYEDISTILDHICDRKSLRIYDPYYCNGEVKERLGSLGYPFVINEPVDFYVVDCLTQIFALNVFELHRLNASVEYLFTMFLYMIIND